MSQSIWTETKRVSSFEPLQKDTTTDILIIGGGMCGILCARLLKEQGTDCLVVEKDTVGGGITQNTTAKITFQHGLLYGKLIRSLGREKASAYFRANQEAVKKYRELGKQIDCDFEETTAGVFSRGDRAVIEAEVCAMEELGFPAEFKEELPLPFRIQGAVVIPGQAQFHPLKFMEGIAGGLKICEQTHVQKVEGHEVWTDRGRIKAQKIIVATHFPFLNLRGSYFLKLYQRRSYVLALKNAMRAGGMYVEEVQDGLSFRDCGELLLIGGGGHRTGKRGGGWRELREFAGIAYPGAEEVSHWAAQDCMSLDGIPYIGHYSKNTPDLYVASGFNKWGMTSSMAAAMILCDMVRERKNEWEEVFSPSRNMLKPQLLVNGAEAVSHLLMPSLRRCPHMGCALKWNSREHTWDCPCHGSRFEEDGTLIDNPANRDA